MAKKEKSPKGKGKGKATEEKAEKKGVETKKYTISHLAAELEVEPASARVQLRKHGIKKAGGRYGWDTKEEMMEVVKTLRSKAKAKAAEAEDDEDEEEEEDDED